MICCGLLVADPLLRFIIGPWARLDGRRRPKILTAFIQFMARFVLRPLEIIGGASFPPSPALPCRPGHLILMNHQSIFDIPLVVRAVPDGYPRIVTRRRYTRWIPLISQITRLYQYPSVDPAANPREARRMLSELRRAARDSEVPLAIFPEGTRTKDGEIGPFRTRGLGLILRARPWTVHVLVADGFWRHAKFKNLLRNPAGVQGSLSYVGSFDWSDPKADPEPFIQEVRRQMVDELARMRTAVSA